MIKGEHVLRLIRVVYQQVHRCDRINEPEMPFEHEVDVLGIPLKIRGEISHGIWCRTTVEKRAPMSWMVTDDQWLYMAWLWRTCRLRDKAQMIQSSHTRCVAGAEHLQHDLAILLLLNE